MSSRSRSGATELEAFIRQCQHGLAHQLQGNSGPFLEVWSHADDVAILGAIGSYARGWEDVKTHILGAAKTLNWTHLAVEPVVTSVADGLGLSVALERMTRGEQDARTLRVTQAYRHEGGNWRLILRHANTVTAEDESQVRSLLALDPTVIIGRAPSTDGPPDVSPSSRLRVYHPNTDNERNHRNGSDAQQNFWRSYGSGRG